MRRFETILGGHEVCQKVLGPQERSLDKGKLSQRGGKEVLAEAEAECTLTV